jgi:large subunit ribosomal protein L30
MKKKGTEGTEGAEKAKAAAPTKDAAPAKAAAKASARVAGPETPSQVSVTQLRAALDTKQQLALRGLGLRRIRHTVSVVDTPSTRGLILKVRHLVEVKA